MIPSLDPLEQVVRQVLGIDVVICLATDPLNYDELTLDEKAVVDRFTSTDRTHDWLCGRKALKQVLSQTQRDPNTAQLTWPQADLSLSHSNGSAIAIAARNRDATLGLGIDMEANRTVSERAARFFLTPAEQTRPFVGDRTDMLLRLWTVKEALFKADPHNHGRVLADYEVTSLDLEGQKASGPTGERFSYGTFAFPGGWISFARCTLCLEEDNATDHRK